MAALNRIAIQPCGPIFASIRPPGSKSITNRALVCAALADGRSILRGALDSEDTRVMIDSLQQLGIRVAVNQSNQTIRVEGCAGRIAKQQADLFVANSGTSMRFLTALVTLGRGSFRLAGIERMHQRPIADLLDALNALNADAVSEANNGCPPVLVNASGLRGGSATIRGDISSQFLSALLMAAPYAARDVELTIDGELVSKPYVQMTCSVMSAFGVAVESADLTRFRIPAKQVYSRQDYNIEPDASAASYFWGAAAITGGQVTVEGLSRSSLQGDVRFCECLREMGCDVDYREDAVTVTGKALKGVEVNMNAISDTVQTLAVVALFANGPTTITGVAHIRHKETDRIGDLARELRRLGATVEELPDGLRIIPASLHAAEIETYNDHRMAMSFALAGLRVPGVVIKDPRCTEKTYPNFFRDLAAM